VSLDHPTGRVWWWDAHENEVIPRECRRHAEGIEYTVSVRHHDGTFVDN
jgi:hypothetical protein